MADISSFLKKILSAIYGEEVRGSIHDALAAMNTESLRRLHSPREASRPLRKMSTSRPQTRKKQPPVLRRLRQRRRTRKRSPSRRHRRPRTPRQRQRLPRERSRPPRSSEAETLGAQATADRNAAEEARAAAEAARDAAVNSQNGAKASEDAAAVSKTDAEAAKTAAVDARDKAQTAKTAAENARESAENSEANAKTYKESAAESAATAQQYSGKPPKPENGTWWIWDAEKSTYVNTNISCELTGPTGNGIQSIQLTQGNHTPGSTDIYTVTMTDGSKYNIAVYNGLNGTGTGDVLGIHFDLVLPASGWSNGSITVAESRLVAAAKYKYLIDAYEASREEYLECNVRPKDISTTGFITFVNDTDPIKDITVNIVRLELSVNAEEGGE